MLNSDAPSKIAIPFANGGSRNVIPVPSQIGITPGAASYTDGFPPLTATDPTAGGIAPAQQDFNGILYAVTQAIQWTDAGGLPVYDSAFSTAVGGYPKGSVLQSADLTGMWVCTADNNATNPDAGGAGWTPLFFYGGGSQAVGGSNVTLSQVQAAKPLIFVTGTLTANVTLTFPTWVKQWLVVNNTTGAFTLSAKTSTGAAITLLPGSNLIYGDGANVLSNVVTTQSFTSKQSLTTSGYQVMPGGLIAQWGSLSLSFGAATDITFPIAFTTACFGVFPSIYGYVSIQESAGCVSSVTTTGFHVQHGWIGDSAGTPISPATINWFSLGR